LEVRLVPALIKPGDLRLIRLCVSKPCLDIDSTADIQAYDVLTKNAEERILRNRNGDFGNVAEELTEVVLFCKYSWKERVRGTLTFSPPIVSLKRNSLPDESRTA
jgi:hypothetical protein